MKGTSKFGGALSKLRASADRPEQTEPGEASGSAEAGAALPTSTPTTGTPEFGQSGIPELPNSGIPVREKYSTYIDGELVTRLKVLAARTRRKHHQIVEDALREYLERHDLG